MGTTAQSAVGRVRKLPELENSVCTVHRLGTVPYGQAWDLQQRLVRRRKENQEGDSLLLLEHPAVITLGRNAKREHLLTPERVLHDQGIDVFETDRGGDVTYHGPGQLVGYPILNLTYIRKDVVWYVRTLEEIIIRAMADFGISARRIAGRTGVWAEGEKLASIGIHISRWVTSHGFALNLDTNLEFFRHIIPCGIESCRMTSATRLLGAPIERSVVEERIVFHFGELFGLNMRPAFSEDL